MNLTTVQLQTLKADIQGNTDPDVVAALAVGSNNGIAIAYNRDSAFWVWKSLMELEEAGRLFDGNDMGNITAANAERVQIFFATQPGGVIPERADHRDVRGHHPLA